MEMVTFRSEAVAVKKLIVSTFVVETVLAAQRSMLCFLLLVRIAPIAWSILCTNLQFFPVIYCCFCLVPTFFNYVIVYDFTSVHVLVRVLFGYRIVYVGLEYTRFVDNNFMNASSIYCD